MDEFWGLLVVLIPLIIKLFERKPEKDKKGKSVVGKPEVSEGKEWPSMKDAWGLDDMDAGIPEIVDTARGQDGPTEVVEAVSLEEGCLPEQDRVQVNEVPFNKVVDRPMPTAQKSDGLLPGKEGVDEETVGGISLRDAVIHQVILERKYF